jgi:hypothetical protein
MDMMGLAAVITAVCGGVAILLTTLVGVFVSLSNRKNLTSLRSEVNGVMHEGLQAARVAAFQEGWRECEKAAQLRRHGIGPGGASGPASPGATGSPIGG